MQGKNKITVKAIAGCAMLAAISIVMARLLCFGSLYTIGDIKAALDKIG